MDRFEHTRKDEDFKTGSFDDLPYKTPVEYENIFNEKQIAKVA